MMTMRLYGVAVELVVELFCCVPVVFATLVVMASRAAILSAGLRWVQKHSGATVSLLQRETARRQVKGKTEC